MKACESRSTYHKSISNSSCVSIFPCHSISAFPSALFYDGLLATPEDIAEQRKAGTTVIASISKSSVDGSVYSFGNIALVDVFNKDRSALEVRSEGGDGIGEGTYRNEREAQEVVRLAKEITNMGDYKAGDIGGER